jgi:hypothetical protein
MSRPRLRPASSGTRTAPASGTPAPEGPDASALRRLAELVADGRSDVPADLPAPARRAVEEEVRRLLRARLTRFIARAIAARLCPDPGTS